VRWPDMSSVPAQVRPILRDQATGRQVYMRTVQGYEFSLREGRRVLEISLGGTAEEPVTVSGLATSAVGDGTEISYTLSSDAEVQVSVLNIGGRLVRTVLDGAVQPAGAQRVVWNGISKSGTKAPNGLYLVRVSARADDGQKAQAIASLMLRR